MLFPFTLRGQALAWFNSVGGYAIATFDELIKEFIAKYFPPTKMEKIRKDIQEFKQQKDESFKDA